MKMVFLSTPSARRATPALEALVGVGANFYPRPPRGGRRRWRSLSAPKGYFYPRPPRGGRRCRWRWWPWPAYFYPRPPRGGRRTKPTARTAPKKFLSTPSARRATSTASFCTGVPENFYPRPPRGGRPQDAVSISGLDRISIHALREEGDAAPVRGWSGASYFYPRPPRGGRLTASRQSGLLLDFYPRPPRGGRHSHFESQAVFLLFLSTPSARRATAGPLKTWTPN